MINGEGDEISHADTVTNATHRSIHSNFCDTLKWKKTISKKWCNSGWEPVKEMGHIKSFSEISQGTWHLSPIWHHSLPSPPPFLHSFCHSNSHDTHSETQEETKVMAIVFPIGVRLAFPWKNSTSDYLEPIQNEDIESFKNWLWSVFHIYLCHFSSIFYRMCVIHKRPLFLPR